MLQHAINVFKIIEILYVLFCHTNSFKFDVYFPCTVCPNLYQALLVNYENYLLNLSLPQFPQF